MKRMRQLWDDIIWVVRELWKPIQKNLAIGETIGVIILSWPFTEFFEMVINGWETAQWNRVVGGLIACGMCFVVQATIMRGMIDKAVKPDEVWRQLKFPLDKK